VPITWSTLNPGVELSPVNRVEIFCYYMDDFITWTISTLELCNLWLFYLGQSKLQLRQGIFKEISYLKVEAGKSISV
jgi:hypothetical protein